MHSQGLSMMVSAGEGVPLVEIQYCSVRRGHTYMHAGLCVGKKSEQESATWLGLE